MRLGFFLDEWRDGGIPAFLERLERFLTGEGHEVIFFLANPYSKREPVLRGLYLELKKRLGDRCVSLDLDSFPRKWQVAHLSRIIRARGIDGLLLNQFTNYIHLLGAIASEVPLVSVAHADIDYYYMEFLRTMEFTRAQVAVSQRIHQKMVMLAPPSQAGRIHYIANGVEESGDFEETPEGPLRVVYCARLDPVQKRCQDLAPLWKAYRQRGGQGELTIVGMGRNENFLKTALREERQTGRVVLRGQIPHEEVLAEMARSDVLLNISNFEGLPQVVLEGASLGLYPLLSDIESGHREIVETLGAGTLCHVGDVDAYATELVRLEADLPGLRRQRVAIRKKARQGYALATCGRRYLEVMEEARQVPPPRLSSVRHRPTLWEWVVRYGRLAKYRRHFKQR